MRIPAHSGVWAPAEPVWPKDEAGKLWQAYSLMAGHGEWAQSWPMTVGELCAKWSERPSDPRSDKAGALRKLDHFCGEKTGALPFHLGLEGGAYPIGKRYPLGGDFETFAPNWTSKRVDPETARRWADVPFPVKAEAGYPVSSNTFVFVRAGIRRDIAAWHSDPAGLNLPLDFHEVDLNEPSLGYFHAESGRFTATVGRFPVHWSPSPEFGLALSHSVPFHNAAEFSMKALRWRYRFLVSSLNPWLQGTPLGDTSSENYPPGSEEYRQRHYGNGNGAAVAHNRVYAERVKTLFAHRMEGKFGPVELGVTEIQVIGGKVPDLRDAGPFTTFHNDFKDGYTNSSVSLDASWHLGRGFSLAGEFYMDDLRYGSTESDGNTASLFGYLAAVRHAMKAGGWMVSQSLHAIRTDPFLYGYLQPLNTMASRHILASNFEFERGSKVTDRYVVDYPMGYLRGGDAYDFWYSISAWNEGGLRIAGEAAVLARGEIGMSTPYEEFRQSGHESPTGVPEREARLRMDVGYRWRHGLYWNAGAGWQGILNEGHMRGKEGSRAQLTCGIGWSVGK